MGNPYTMLQTQRKMYLEKRLRIDIATPRALFK